MDEWEIYLTRPWFILPKSFLFNNQTQQRVLFHKNGHVKLLNTKNIGIWRLYPNGLLWFTFPFCIHEANLIKTYYLQYSSFIHINSFGASPKLIRGIVTRDCYCGNKVIRPVIATFYAKGAGVDTIDTTYKRRNR
jgi:hypothetical protein